MIDESEVEVPPATNPAASSGHDHRSSRRPTSAHPELVILVVLLALGVILRVYFTFQWRPSLTGYSDSGIYFQDASKGLFADPLRVVGYGIFLNALHFITPHLLFVTVVQHLMGLATGVLFFLIVRRTGGPAWLGLVPAAIVILGGDQVFYEHAALSETLFTFLVAVMLYGAVHAWQGSFAWGALAGAGAGLAVTVRGAGSILVPLAFLWILFCRGRPTQDTALAAILALVISLGCIAGYMGWRHANTGLSGLTTNGNWNLYGRVAPFADCTKFTPPAGTEGLCETTPPPLRKAPAGATLGSSERLNAEFYIYSPLSPAQKLFGPPFEVSPDPNAMEALKKFSIAAIKAQPLDYLDAVWNDSIRVVMPDHPSLSDLSADQNIAFLIGGPDLKSGKNDFVASWQDPYYPKDKKHMGNMTLLRDYEKFTRVSGIWMLLLLAFAAAAPFAVPRRCRAGALLFLLTAFALLWFPIITKGYDFRFEIPALGPLVSAAALGVWGLVGVTRLRVETRWSRAPRVAPPVVSAPDALT